MPSIYGNRGIGAIETNSKMTAEFNGITFKGAYNSTGVSAQGATGVAGSFQGAYQSTGGIPGLMIPPLVADTYTPRNEGTFLLPTLIENFQN